VGELERGRDAYDGEAWAAAYEALSAADRSGPLAARDLELLANAAYMIGRDGDYLGALERAHRAHLDAGEPLAALRCAFWIGFCLARTRGETARASGWIARARRLLDAQGRDCVERGYLLLAEVSEPEVAAEAAAIAQRFGDPDLFALAARDQGHILIKGGRFEEGLRLLDEAMVAVTAGEVSPVVSGVVYCSVILACQDAHEVSRAREWTVALTRWCERQPDLVAFTGRCLVDRAGIMQLRGAWADALTEARRAGERSLRAENPAPAGEAFYRQGEIHRLRGELTAAEEAYRAASGHGWEPQPGLALLRLAQGRTDAAAAAIRRGAAETSEPVTRARLLPACVEIMLAVGEAEAAQDACRELESIAARREGGTLPAMAAHARGLVDLEAGDARAALGSLRRAGELWAQLDAPYEAARIRELVGLACRALGDEDTAALELDAARAAFARLGAAPDAARIDSLTHRLPPRTGRLTERELEVLRHLVAGETNKAIAAELILSERTVDRHVSNIFVKLGVSSRVAATAYAYEHRLV
jgi:DNA-binding CsgD family transcriptional regulator